MEETCNSKGPITPPHPSKEKKLHLHGYKAFLHMLKKAWFPFYFYFFLGNVALGMDYPFTLVDNTFKLFNFLELYGQKMISKQN
jgi:hypothetical protein